MAIKRRIALHITPAPHGHVCVPIERAVAPSQFVDHREPSQSHSHLNEAFGALMNMQAAVAAHKARKLL